MSPWSPGDAEKQASERDLDAENEALGLPASFEDESFERALFAQRARALPTSPVAPLAAVLRQAKISPKRPKSSVRVRTVEVLLAAACMALAIWKVPRFEPAKAIVADVDASVPSAVLVGGFSSADECTVSDDIVASEGRACFEPEPEVPAQAPCTGDKDPPIECTDDQSCALPPR